MCLLLLSMNLTSFNSCALTTEVFIYKETTYKSISAGKLKENCPDMLKRYQP